MNQAELKPRIAGQNGETPEELVARTAQEILEDQARAAAALEEIRASGGLLSTSGDVIFITTAQPRE